VYEDANETRKTKKMGTYENIDQRTMARIKRKQFEASGARRPPFFPPCALER
jgi:hypothetical protein